MNKEIYLDAPVIKETSFANGFLDTVTLLISREWRRLMMEPSRVISVLAQPLLFLAVFGVGFHETFSLSDQDVSYASFFFPGILGLVVLFSSIYATLTLVEDKKCGFFRLVLIGPGGVYGALCGKILATAALGFSQSLLFLPLAFLFPLEITPESLGFAVVFLAIGSLCFSFIGVLFAWISPSASAFHALMSIILIPMWLLSGAMFPANKGFFAWLSVVNPMAYLVSGLRACLLEQTVSSSNFGWLIIFSALALLSLLAVVKKRPIE